MRTQWRCKATCLQHKGRRGVHLQLIVVLVVIFALLLLSVLLCTWQESTRAAGDERQAGKQQAAAAGGGAGGRRPFSHRPRVCCCVRCPASAPAWPPACQSPCLGREGSDTSQERFLVLRRADRILAKVAKRMKCRIRAGRLPGGRAPYRPSVGSMAAARGRYRFNVAQPARPCILGWEVRALQLLRI